MSPKIYQEFDPDTCQYEVRLEWLNERGGCRISFIVGDDIGVFQHYEGTEMPIFEGTGKSFDLEEGISGKALEVFRRIVSGAEPAAKAAE